MEKEAGIQIMEKPDWVSWDDIHEVLWAAHAKNREDGIIMAFPSLAGDEIRRKIGSEGKMFVAMDGDKVVGTVGIMKGNGNPWYAKGNYGHTCFASVLPNYGGNGIYQLLNKKREIYAIKNNYSVLIADTNERNRKMIEIKKKEGYRFICYMACKDHFNVGMAKWLQPCPFPSWYITFRFYFSMIYQKTRFKMVPRKGRTKRFGI